MERFATYTAPRRSTEIHRQRPPNGCSGGTTWKSPEGPSQSRIFQDRWIPPGALCEPRRAVPGASGGRWKSKCKVGPSGAYLALVHLIATVLANIIPSTMATSACPSHEYYSHQLFVHTSRRISVAWRRAILHSDVKLERHRVRPTFQLRPIVLKSSSA